jgi:hypothetical protein
MPSAARIAGTSAGAPRSLLNPPYGETNATVPNSKRRPFEPRAPASTASYPIGVEEPGHGCLRGRVVPGDRQGAIDLADRL